ncbi:hypothetical protein M404DRAFT_132258 [Pisolithus tinctorius Marx 270]|uniref:Uncharacterized protein n=1 Tax=Pisolithus tinctorius Marx 270 TaxID=870435 RepID=A0A0C3KHS7_PISTI|nr:hypothetical protein M404DRAFT_132258 [Pisolithus tinctorius Marx 270]
MSENRSRAEGILQAVESGLALLRKVPRSTLSHEVSEWNNNVGVVINESSVEIWEAEEGLDVSHLLWLRPVADCLNLLSGHGETGGRKNITKVLDGVGVKLTLLWLGIKAMLSKAAEYLFYVFTMRLHHVCKDAIDESLESRRRISQTEWHYPPLVVTIRTLSLSSLFFSSYLVFSSYLISQTRPGPRSGPRLTSALLSPSSTFRSTMISL